jgi:hypothetical protein
VLLEEQIEGLGDQLLLRHLPASGKALELVFLVRRLGGM